MHKIRFTKMHGCGNDYIYVDASLYPIADPAALALRVSHRHKGIGSDGLVLISRCPAPERLRVGEQGSEKPDFSMRIFNADGSEARMCGNASRCIAKYVYERGLTDKQEIRLLTPSGIKTLSLHIRADKVESVTVDMGEPRFDVPEQFLPDMAPARGTFVSMGNPHYVVFTDEVDCVGERGPALEHHPAFPQRCNIEFARIEAAGTIRTRVWERGSGITQACGTGACATAVAAACTGRASRRSAIVMDGGSLHIEWREADNHVCMTGPAEFVFDGEIEI